MLGQQEVLVPPLAEQRSIADFLDSKVADFKRISAAAAAGIAGLKEYRARLFAEVVTGKLDVREATARLPEESEELEPLDDGDALPLGDEEARDVELEATTEDADA